MNSIFLRLINKLFSVFNIVLIKHIKTNNNSFLCKNYKSIFFYSKSLQDEKEINDIANKTNLIGNLKIWDGYGGSRLGSERTPNKVRTAPLIGSFYLKLVMKLKPKNIIEVGTAFGVSGMFFLSGIKSNGFGKLITFEPNDVWIEYARQNLSKISSNFNSILGEFELNAEKYIENNSIELIFIDGIHERAFVREQLNTAMPKLKKGAVIILDDINFSRDFNNYWLELASDDKFLASLQIGNRVGILELA
jgi:hypothetical protein